MEVRLAINSEGSIIRKLAEYSTLPQEFKDVLDWDDIYPYWLVAENGAGIIGCIQVCPGKPVGRVENLSIDPTASGQMRAKAFKMLVDEGLNTLRQMGSTASSSMVLFENKAAKRVFKRHFGGKVTASGNIIMKAL